MTEQRTVVAKWVSLIRRDWIALVLVGLWPVVHFLSVLTRESVWYTTDIVRLFYPFASELAQALGRGSLPFWAPGLLGGFPLLAEGQVGALYPANIVLLKLFPAHIALSYGILFHLVWAACGMYVCIRSMRMSEPAAVLGGMVFSLSGFALGQISHPSIIATYAWLPWLIAFQEQARQARRHGSGSAKWIVLSALGLGIQFLAGSVQLAFLNLLAFLFFGLVGELCEDRGSLSRQAMSLALVTLLPVILGIGMAAVQLLPTNELLGYSVRNETSESFVTSYSLPPAWLAQFLAPFAQGEPAEGNDEYWGYFGIVPLILAMLAPLLRRDRKTWLSFGFVAAVLILSLGGLFPLYRWLANVPIIGQFRVPARYLHLAVFGGALLGAIGLEELFRRAPRSSRRPWLWVGAAIAVIVASIGLANTQALETWLQAWTWLPIMLIGLSILGLLAINRQWMPATSFAILAIALAGIDLTIFSAPFERTIDALTPTSYVDAVPRSVAALGVSEPPERIWTDFSTFPSVQALRASLFPNTALPLGRSSAQIYSSLALARQEAFVSDPSPTMLNLMNVRYLMIPLEPRPRSKSSAPSGAMGLDVLDNEVMLPPTAANQIVISSYTEDASGLDMGTSVAELQVRLADGRVRSWPIRSGVETADWDYERKAATEPTGASRAPIAHDFSAYWRSFGRAFDGHTYMARYALGPEQVTGIVIRSIRPEARLAVESVRLVSGAMEIPLADLSGKNEFRLAYMSDTVAAWENRNVMPRAFLVHSARVADESTAFQLLRENSLRPDREVILDQAGPSLEPDKPGDLGDRVEITEYQNERVTIELTTDRSGYLVLGDSWYPGWQARVDGQLSPVYRADLIFRAVVVGPGSHQVVFTYQPMSFYWGVILSFASVLALAIVALFVKRAERVRLLQSEIAPIGVRE